MNDFLPITKQDMEKRGWTQPDFVYVIGDAYVDHSSFGPAIISRVLEDNGFKVAIISQPDWKSAESIDVFGEPRLGFLVSAGNMDSMVNHYTVNKKRRSTDAYTPGGEIGKRPNMATIVYCNLIRQKYKNAPIIIGGIEASLRRFAHYDYWQNKLKHSILLDSQADLLIYGMGELAIVEVAKGLNEGLSIEEITYVKGTAYKAKSLDGIFDGITLPTFEELTQDKTNYAKSFYIQYKNADFKNGKTLCEPYEKNLFVVQNPPQRPLTTEEMDRVYELPYMNDYHPSYKEKGGVPSLAEIKFSLVSNRGCFGGCSFCALTFHQGRVVQVRSHESIIREAEKMTKAKDFKGYIHDVGGPTANFRAPACQKQTKFGACPERQCLFPSPCKNLVASHEDYIALLRKLRKIPGVKKVFIRSGIRFDYVMKDPNGDKFLKEICENHISGQLRVAPEHVSDNVLRLMGKPPASVYEDFVRHYNKINGDKKQYVLPYLISSHPGSTLKDAVKLAEAIRDMGYCPEQVQDFYPTPSTISTVMYYTGVDPRTMKPIYIPSNPKEKAMQRALLQYKNPENYQLVHEALVLAGRRDLIGSGKNCLIQERTKTEKTTKTAERKRTVDSKKTTKDIKTTERKQKNGNYRKKRT